MKWLLAAILFCALFVVAMGFAHQRALERAAVYNARVRDLQALTGVCFASTNIHSTADLLARARQLKVALASPIAADPSKPCYVLVNAVDFSSTSAIPLIPGMILIAETNTTDTNTILVSTMDRSVQALPYDSKEYWKPLVPRGN